MPTFTLDGREIPFEKGETIIRAAYRQGIEIPHYCWHPGLSVAANCRMCLVEIDPPPGQRPMLLDILRWDPEKKDYVPERKPKLQPACQVAAVEGMVVRSEASVHAAEARAHVQEFLLLNHPVDCPICDQAGECKLQDYWLSHDRMAKRMREEPVHKPKAVPFGETIVYDAERCIACTRCVRVCDELVHDHMLDLRERGNKNEVVLAPGRSLEGQYTLMTEHVCPVGALTSSHFRFKARVWLLRGTATVCPGCATGCNAWIDVDPREQRAYRHRPRDNEAVNKYWMCDDGMMTYRRVHEGRVLEAALGRDPERAEVSLERALEKAATELGKVPREKVAVVLSAQFGSEDNLVLAELARALGAKVFLAARPPWAGDAILRHTDQNPNRAGALAVAGSVPGSLAALCEAAAAGEVVALVGLGADADVDASALSPLSRLAPVVLFATHAGPLARHATVTLPAATWAETEGTFVNAQGMAQTFKRALVPQGDALPAWDLAARLGRALGLDLAYRRFADVRAALAARTAPRAAAAPQETGA